MKSFKDHNSIFSKDKDDKVNTVFKLLGIVKAASIVNMSVNKVKELWNQTKTNVEQAYEKEGRDLAHERKVAWMAGLVICAVIAGVATNNITKIVKAKGEIDYTEVLKVKRAVDDFMRTWGGR